MIQPTLINLHPNEYSQEFHYYPFAVKLDKCVGSCNNLNDLCNKVCVPNKTGGLNLSMFSMITGINESKTLTKHISCKRKCTFDEIIESYNEETKTIPTNFNEKKPTCKTQNFYILLPFLLITIALLIVVSIYCCLIKY